MFNYPLFASKQTFARIDFLRQGGRLVDEKGTHNVKFIAEKLTKKINLTSGQVNELIVVLSCVDINTPIFDIRT